MRIERGFRRSQLTEGSGAAGAIRHGDDFLSDVALFSDGEKVFDVPAPLADVTATLPTGQRPYRLTTEVSRPASLSAVSTRGTAEWTFRSTHRRRPRGRRTPEVSADGSPTGRARNVVRTRTICGPTRVTPLPARRVGANMGQLV
ncbi:hypothetical protein [Streptomyces deccanensis]|uniref:hypothetical protein n=1 Tax=Streptomyces deccanensis TaxID=424188 RepID=UPI001EFA4334|nr:hypothetical protein [Streptomyces deccanensis]ULR52149.1 hypothetical protein L3078_24260 [Streptomyces deccanensis]